MCIISFSFLPLQICGTANDFIFTVDDLERETARLIEKGVSVVFSGRHQNSSTFAYLDTREDGGDIMIRLTQAG